MGYRRTISEKAVIPAMSNILIDTFVIICMIYLTNVPAVYVGGKHGYFAKILVVASSNSCSKTSAWRGNGLIVFHMLLGLHWIDLEVDCSTDCLWETWRDNILHSLQKGLYKNYGLRAPLKLTLFKLNWCCRICCSYAVSVLRIKLGPL